MKLNVTLKLRTGSVVINIFLIDLCMLRTNLKVLSSANEYFRIYMMPSFFIFSFVSCLHFVYKVRKGTSSRSFEGVQLHIYLPKIHSCVQVIKMKTMQTNRTIFLNKCQAQIPSQFNAKQQEFPKVKHSIYNIAQRLSKIRI